MNILDFQHDLKSWYLTHQRHVPWRENQDPYRIWISEIMLQQTQVSTVISYFNRFIEAFPTLHHLAQASIEAVYKVWEGLGYYRRARHLHETAILIDAYYHGVFPNTYDSILQLKGIGPYTAAAIASICFNEAVGVVDGNIFRVLSRLQCIDENIALPRTRKHFQQLMNTWIDPLDPSSFNQGLMEIGALICKKDKPLCHLCPLTNYCSAYKNNTVLNYPVNQKKPARKHVHFIASVLTYDMCYFMYQTTSDLLHGLYQFPMFEVESVAAFESNFLSTFDTPCQLHQYVGEVTHVFTHIVWHLKVYRGTVAPGLTCFSLQQIKLLPISSAHLKVASFI